MNWIDEWLNATLDSMIIHKPVNQHLYCVLSISLYYVAVEVYSSLERKKSIDNAELSDTRKEERPNFFDYLLKIDDCIFDVNII